MNKHADIHTDSYLVLCSPMTAVLQLLEKNLADHWKTCSRGMELKIGFKYIRNSAQESGDPEWRRHNLMHCTHGQLKIRVRRQSLALSSLFIFPPESASLLGFTPVISGSVWEPQKKNACGWLCLLLSSVQFSRSVVSDSLWPHEPQHARPPCPSPIPRVHPNPCPLSRWCHPTISFSVVPFSSCPQSFPASGSFQMSQLFASSSAPYQAQSLTSSTKSCGVASASRVPVQHRLWQCSISEQLT